MKLLQATIRQYFMLSLIVMVLAVPTFYFLLNALVKEEMDEELLTRKTEVVARLHDVLLNDTAAKIEPLDSDLIIARTQPTQLSDSFYTVSVYDSLAQESIPHRMLRSRVLINGEAYEMHIRTSMLDYDNMIEGIVAVQAFLMLVLFIGVQQINRKLSRRLLDPFYKTLLKLKQYKVEEQGSLHFPMSGIIEFDDLNDAITQLTGRTFQAYKSQKEFVENASHELQTPLTILQSKLELLMQTSPLNSEQAELISSMADTSQRMNRLNKTLLLLSKIDSQVYTEKKEFVNMGSVIRDVIRQYEDAIEQKDLQVYVDDSSAPSVLGNKTLLEILSSNLVFNAIRHNVPGGYVGVTLTAHEITVENTGAVNPLDTNRLFRRFQKHSSDANSLGLGLEIINKICRINDFKLQYNFIGMKHRFTIKLGGDSV